MNIRLDKINFLIENDTKFLKVIKRLQRFPKFRPYDIETIRYLQPIICTLQIESDEEVLDLFAKIIDNGIDDYNLRRKTIAIFLGYSNTYLEEVSELCDMNDMQKHEIFLLWEKINSLYIWAILTTILKTYPSILEDK